MTFIVQKHITTTTAVLVAIAGLLVISGWYFHVPALAQLFPGAMPARINAGFCFILAGIALFLHHRPDTRRSSRFIVQAASWLILFTGLFTLLQYITGTNFGIDTLLLTTAQQQGDFVRMTIPASIFFILLGTMLLVLPYRKFHLFIHVSNILIILGSLLTLLDFLSRTTYSDKLLKYYSSSPAAAATFILVCTGIHYSRHLEYLKVSFQKKIAGFFLLTFLVLGFFFLALNKINKGVSQAMIEEKNMEKVSSILEETKTQVEAMQNAIKNFLLLNNPEQLADYKQIVTQISSNLTELQSYSIRDGNMNRQSDSLLNQLQQYFNSRAELLSRHQAAGFSNEEIRQITESGKIRIDSVRALLASIRGYHQKADAALKQESQEKLNTSQWIIGLSQVFTVLFLLLALYMIYLNSRSRDKAEMAFDKSEKFLKAVINNSKNPIAIRDLHGRYMKVNAPLAELVGKTKEEMKGKTLWEMHPGSVADTAKEADDLVIASRESMTQETASTITGSKRYYTVSRFPIFNEQNTIYAVGTIATDITTLHHTQVLLEEFQHFFLNSNDLCIIGDITGEFENINPTTLAVLGYSREDMLGKSFIDFVHPDDILFIIKEIERGKAAGATSINFSRRFIKKNGDYIWINWKASTGADQKKIYAIGRDITDQKNLELKLKQFNMELEKQVAEKTRLVMEKEHQYRFLLENMREGIQIIGFDWRYLFVNNSVVGQSQYANDKELVGFTMMEKYPGIENTELFRVLERCMVERQPDTIENFFLFPNGEKGWFELSIQPVPEGIFILSIDITDRKKADEKLSNYTEDLKRSNAELERFAYVASHDLQEPLRMVSSFMNLLQRRLSDKLDDTSKQYMHYAVDGADRMKTLIHDLLEYSRVGTHRENFVLIDPMEVMNYVTRVLDEDIQKTGATIIIHPMPTIMASKTLFSQLLVNLISNALKYNGNRAPQIEVGCLEDHVNYTFSVKDNGEGIDPKFFDKIFIIFQRLHNKGEYSGTGIGLAICKKIVEVHRGKIWVESEKDKGSTFFFTIPKSAYETGRS